MVTIGRISRQSGVSVQAVRYYERRGFIRPLRRTTGGYRVYDERPTVARIASLRGAQGLGFTLNEAHRMLKLGEKGGDAHNKIMSLLDGRLADLELEMERERKRLSALRKVRAVFERFTRRPRKPCPLQRLFIKHGLGAGGTRFLGWLRNPSGRKNAA